MLLWNEYEACRATQFVAYRRPERDGKERLINVTWPSGFSTLPFDGGWEDQPYYYTKIFLAFLKGEQQGVIERLIK